MNLIFNEPGKVYSKCYSPNGEYGFQEDELLYKFSSSTFEMVKDTIYRNSKDAGITFREEIRPASLEWIYDRKEWNRCLNGNPEHCITVALIEQPAEYKTLSFSEQDSFLIVERFNLLELAKVEEVLKDFPTISLKDQSYSLAIGQQAKQTFLKLKVGKWTGWREVLCGCGRGLSIQTIQEKLKKLGYLQESEYENNRLDDTTKMALTRFQKHNHLPIGQVNQETLKRLGIEF